MKTMPKIKWVFFLCFTLASIGILLFTLHNEKFYKSPVASIVDVQEQASGTATGQCGERERYKKQKVTVQLINTSQKGKKFTVNNLYGTSQVKTHKYKKGDKVFVTIYSSSGKQRVAIEGLKRDYYAVGLLLVLSFLTLLFGKKAGIRTIASMVINLCIFYVFILLYEKGIALWGLAILLMIFFSVMTLFLLNGFSAKMLVAAASTLGTLFVCFVLYLIAIHGFKEIPYYMMEHLVLPEKELRHLFMVSVLVGSMGAIMDVAVLVSSSIYEIIEVTPKVSQKELIRSVQNMGHDIMGTMQNVLLFTYLSGIFPTMFLMLRSGYFLNTLLPYDFSFEIVRFLVGSIGIVLAIPVSGFFSITIYQAKNKRGWQR